MKSRSLAHLQLRQREPVRDGLLRIAASLAPSHPPEIPKDPAATAALVHQTRLALKQSRALLRLLRASLGREIATRINTPLQSASKRLAPNRDATVVLHWLDQLATAPKKTRIPGVSDIRSALNAQPKSTVPTSAALARNLTQADRTLRRTAAALAKADWKHRGWAILASGIQAGYRRSRKRYQSAQKRSDPATFHSWRTASKSLFYQLAILRPIAPRRISRLLDDLNALQSTLGAANDLSLLAQRIQSDPKAFGDIPTIQQALNSITRQGRKLHATALKLGKPIYSERTSRFVARLAKEWKAWRKS